MARMKILNTDPKFPGGRLKVTMEIEQAVVVDGKAGTAWVPQWTRYLDNGQDDVFEPLLGERYVVARDG